MKQGAGDLCTAAPYLRLSLRGSPQSEWWAPCLCTTRWLFACFPSSFSIRFQLLHGHPSTSSSIQLYTPLLSITHFPLRTTHMPYKIGSFMKSSCFYNRAEMLEIHYLRERLGFQPFYADMMPRQQMIPSVIRLPQPCTSMTTFLGRIVRWMGWRPEGMFAAEWSLYLILHGLRMFQR